MKKLIFCCLVVLMGACKGKDKDVDPENNFAAEFVGNYGTVTINNEVILTEHLWEIGRVDNNKLKIGYTKNITVSVAGSGDLTNWQKLELLSVTTTAANKFTINETVDVQQQSGAVLRQKVEGEGTKVINAAGVAQINIDLKLTNTATGVATTEYLEFKKK
jgi:hypothetical protein